MFGVIKKHKIMKGIIIATIILTASYTTAANIKTNTTTQKILDQQVSLYILTPTSFTIPSKTGVLIKYDLRAQKYYEGTDTFKLTAKDDKNTFNFYINGEKIDENKPYQFTLKNNEPLDMKLIIENKKQGVRETTTITIKIESKKYKDVSDEKKIHGYIQPDFTITLEKTKKQYKTDEKISFIIKNNGDEFKYEYSEYLILDRDKKITHPPYKDQGDTLEPGEEKTITTPYIANTGEYTILAIFYKENSAYANILQIQVKKTGITTGIAIKPFGWVWMGILDGDWSYSVFYDENGTPEKGIGVELNYKIVAIGYHHIEVKGKYVLFGDFENPSDYYGNFSFPEDSLIFMVKKKTITLSFPGADEMYLDAYLYIDGRRWSYTSIIAP